MSRHLTCRCRLWQRFAPCKHLGNVPFDKLEWLGIAIGRGLGTYKDAAPASTTEPETRTRADMMR